MERVLDGTGFVRFLVVGVDDRTEVDQGNDSRLFPAEQGPGFRILSTKELAVDKVLAVFGRAEARDFLDLMAVESRFGLDALLQLAAEKDNGFDLLVFAEMAQRFDRLRRDEFPVDDEHYEHLVGRVAEWRSEARRLGRPNELHNDRGRGLDIGF